MNKESTLSVHFEVCSTCNHHGTIILANGTRAHAVGSKVLARLLVKAGMECDNLEKQEGEILLSEIDKSNLPETNDEFDGAILTLMWEEEYFTGDVDFHSDDFLPWKRNAH